MVGDIHTHKEVMPVPGKSNSSDSAQSSPPDEMEHARDEFIEMLEENRSWDELPGVRRFLATSDVFLEAHEEIDPSPALRPFLTCVLMLTIHVKWVCAKDEAVAQPIYCTDDGEPAIALLRILRICTNVMKRAMRQQGDSDIDARTYSTRFGFGPPDLRRMQAWNEQWLAMDVKAPCVDTTLIQAADQIH